VSRLVPELYDLIREWETCQLKAYKDRDGTWHVGYGTGNNLDLGIVVDEHTVLANEEEAMALLHKWMEDLEPRIAKIFPKSHLLNDYQFSALVDPGYNRGPGTLRDSALAHHVNVALDSLSNAHDEVSEKAARRQLKIAAKWFVHYDLTDRDGDGKPDFKFLDWSNNRETGAFEHVDGLILRRICDGALYLKKPKG
jgi:lysozyme